MTEGVTVIIPAAGHADHQPTWLQERPDGSLVIDHIIRQLELTFVTEILLVTTLSALQQTCGGDSSVIETHVTQSCRLQAPCKFSVLALADATAHAADTVRRAIIARNVTGAVFIKDCDGAFPHRVMPENCVVGLRVTSENVDRLYDLPAKSYLEECGGVLTNIVEKHIVSDIVSVGGYGFVSAPAVLRAIEAVEAVQETSNNSDHPNNRIFTSHLVVHLLMRERAVFRVTLAPYFEDWKTVSGWIANQRQHRNYIVTLEGVLIKPRPDYIVAKLAQRPIAEQYDTIAENIDALSRKMLSGHFHVVILSTQREQGRQSVEAYLREIGVPWHSLVLGMEMCGSTLVGAHQGPRLPHPGAVGHSIVVGSTNLEEVLSS
jgi:hypothetical protein